MKTVSADKKPSRKMSLATKIMLGNLISVCIVPSDTRAALNESVMSAASFTDDIYLLCGDDDYRTAGNEIPPGVKTLSCETIRNRPRTEWVFFLMDYERIVLRSAEKMAAMLNDGAKNILGVHVKDISIADSLKHFQFISNLGQFRDIANLAFTTRVEPRITRKEAAGEIVRNFLGTGTFLPAEMEGIIQGIKVEPTPPSTGAPVVHDSPEEHDRKCLKGEIYYGPEPGEEIDELSYAFNGFRVFRLKHLDGFRESAQWSLGVDEMYVPMLNYLSRNGLFVEAKGLYDLWMTNRKGEPSASHYTLGGKICAHLLQIEEAICFYEKAAVFCPDISTYIALGELCSIKNDREKAIMYLAKAAELNPGPEGERCSPAAIQADQWRPPVLSVCILARDEKAHIAETIESVKFSADELLVIDTGSQDETRDLALKHGAKVIDIPWKDDFSAARNAGIEQCRGDYIFMIDADESIDIGDRLGFALFKSHLPLDRNHAYRVKVSIDDRQSDLSVSQLSKFIKQLPVQVPVRIFPNREGIRYDGAAFETVDRALEKQGLSIEDTVTFKITHDNNEDERREQRKAKAIQNTYNGIIDSVAALDGGVYFLKSGDVKTASRWFKRIEVGRPTLMAKIASLYLHHNEFESAQDIIAGTRKCFPDAIEPRIVQAAIYFISDRCEDLADLLMPVVRADMTSLSNMYRGDACFYYGMALLETDQITEGIDHLARSMDEDPDRLLYRLGGLFAFSKSEQWDDFFRVAGGIVEDENLNIDFVIEDFSGVSRLMAILYRHFSKSSRHQESKVIERILSHIIRTKISSAAEIERLQNHISDFALSISRLGNAL